MVGSVSSMKLRRFRFLVLFLLSLCVGPRWAATASAQTLAPPALPGKQTTGTPAHKLNLNGVPNFAQVTETLYRGGQPSAAGFRALQLLGIQIVVNFRNEKDPTTAEQRQVEALGMRYISVPWSAFHNPTSQQITEFLELAEANPDKKIFVHCHHGADRTGVMVAAFRMALQNWTPQQALQEMRAFHFHSLLFHHLKSYVEDFPRQLQADPSLRALQHAAHTSAP